MGGAEAAPVTGQPPSRGIPRLDLNSPQSAAQSALGKLERFPLNVGARGPAPRETMLKQEIRALGPRPMMGSQGSPSSFEDPRFDDPLPPRAFTDPRFEEPLPPRA